MTGFEPNSPKSQIIINQKEAVFSEGACTRICTRLNGRDFDQPCIQDITCKDDRGRKNALNSISR